MNIVAPRNQEKPIEGWKSIAAEVELPLATAWRMARRNKDPLPVWSYLNRVIAWCSALREWKSRQILPMTVKERMRPLDGEKNENSENE